MIGSIKKKNPVRVNERSRWFLIFLVGIVLSASAADLPAFAQQKQDRPSSLLNYSVLQGVTEGDGYMVGGEFWETIKPMNTNEENNLEDPLTDLGFVKWIQIGPDGGNWRNPAGMWPGGYQITNSWRDGKRMLFPVFEADGWPGYGPDNVIRANGGDGTEEDRFMFAYYSPELQGAGNPERDYKRPAQFTDRSRSHLVYEAGFPTTAGLDFKIRGHQYTVNEQNLNDFVALEITVTNTGVVDTNGDGTPEQTGHRLDAMGMLLQTLPTIALRVGRTGDRVSNNFGAGRTFGYVAAPDATGAPYNLTVWYPNVPAGRTDGRVVPPAGRRLFGVNDVRRLQGYTDVWNAWSWLGVKRGSSFDAGVDGRSPDKETLFGTHPIGEAARRGWYTSQHPEPSLLGEPPERSDFAFRSATATWYQDYGKTTSADNPPTLEPNPAFFSGGTPDDVTTFQVGNPSARPNGDYKYASEDIGPTGIGQPIWEEAWNPQVSSNDFYAGTGFTQNYTFGNRCYSAIGPFSLEVGESITAVVVLTAGYRFEGVHEATEAARWAWERGWDISGQMPVPPAPDIKLESTENQSTLVRWTDVAGIDPEVDGYKIWRASQFRRTEWLEKGFRLVDRYQHQHEVGADASSFLEPVNRFFDAEDEFAGATQGIYQPSGWGIYDLIAKIPANEVDQFRGESGSYDFVFEDTSSTAIVGFTYWYYVSAYKEGTFTGPQGEVAVGHIESSNFNRNGRNGRGATLGEVSLATPWIGTYPYAELSPDFPELGTQAFKNIGAPFVLTTPTAPVEEADELITVTPNPYKRTALNDVRSNPASHNVTFLNMPESFTLTITDVAGQIIFQATVEGAFDGQYSWNLFSKDGVEVASGLYLYHVEYGNGREVIGHLAILR